MQSMADRREFMDWQNNRTGRKLLETNDIVTKNFESYADVAADIINVLLHEGRRKVKDYEMLSAATESLYLDKENG